MKTNATSEQQQAAEAYISAYKALHSEGSYVEVSVQKNGAFRIKTKFSNAACNLAALTRRTENLKAAVTKPESAL